MADSVPTLAATDDVRARIKNLFEFLKALDDRRNPVPALIEDHRWSLRLDTLPAHSAVHFVRGGQTDGDSGSVWFLKVARPKLTDAPAPPGILDGWVRPGWEKWTGEPVRVEQKKLLARDGSETSVLFEADPARQSALEAYVARHRQWKKTETPPRQAHELFEQLYGLWGNLRREGEASELLLGNAILNVGSPEGDIRHPLLLARVHLDFDSSLPEFRIVDSGHPPDIYHPLFRRLPSVSGELQNDIRSAFEREPVHPADAADVLGQWCGRTVQWLHPRGEALSGMPDGTRDFPRIGECPLLLVRSRTHGYGAALEAILKDLVFRPNLPPVLQEIFRLGSSPLQQDLSLEQRLKHPSAGDTLFALPANKEQVDIARSIERRAGVVVQGPPGTGKTHTIANLIGHYLAHGKSVLVTSHTAKALRVLREKLPQSLQALCVSVLDDDITSREELKHAVHEITSKLSGEAIEEHRRNRDIAKLRRDECLAELTRLRSELRLGRSDEYRPVVVAGMDFEPSRAARFVSQHCRDASWIPSPVENCAPIPLTEEEIAELYATNSLLETDETELLFGLPDSATLLSPEQFNALVDEIRWAEEHPGPSAQLWLNRVNSAEALHKLMGLASNGLLPEDSGGWLLPVIQDSRDDSTAELWRGLLRDIENTCTVARSFKSIHIEYGPELSADDAGEQLVALEKLLAHLEIGGSLDGVTFRILHASWHHYLDTIRVNGRRPRVGSEIAALIEKAKLTQLRKDLALRWKRQVTALGGPDAQLFGVEFETVLAQFGSVIQECLDWHADRWTPLQRCMEDAGLVWPKCLARIPPIEKPFGDLHRIGRALHEVVVPEVDVAIRTYAAARASSEIEESVDHLSRLDSGAAVFGSLLATLRENNVSGYRLAWNRLKELESQQPLFRKRQVLLDKMTEGAMGWKLAICARRGVHGATAVPGNSANAWLWCQFTQELDSRSKRSLAGLQQKIQSENTALERVTTALIESAAWAAQGERMNRTPGADQALRQWAQAVDRATGTGKQAIKLRMTLPSLMTRCYDAVPVWIMPLNRLVENCDPAKTRFDLAIIDESSQASLMGLIPMYLADKVVVVGDDEQVSVEAVAEDTSKVEDLVERYLGDLPEKHLFHPTYSVYDFATARFGSPIRLREHFRCAPEIIQFSNALSYRFEIQPLRDVSRCERRPHVIAHKVEGTRGGGKENSVEAEEIVSLVAAMCELPEYRGASIGVISLLGDQQALLIDSLLRRRIPAKEYDERRLVCGNAYQFQGDERDVMLLSMVDSPDDGPLRLLSGGPREMYRKRYNVAASRARDQMWIVYSLDPQMDLQPLDLRLRLIKHALSPNELMDRLNQVIDRTESEFEKQVAANVSGQALRCEAAMESGRVQNRLGCR